MQRTWGSYGLACLALGAVLCLAGSAWAEDGEGDPERRGPRLGGPPSADHIFDRMDTNKDGSISREEFKKAHERMMARMREFRGGPPQGGPEARPGGRQWERPVGPPWGRGPRDCPHCRRGAGDKKDAAPKKEKTE